MVGNNVHLETPKVQCVVLIVQKAEKEIEKKDGNTEQSCL
jgi:hypothetical protein